MLLPLPTCLLVTRLVFCCVSSTCSSITQGTFLFLLSEATLRPLQLRVKQECSEPAGHVVVGKKLQVEIGELEGHGKLIVQLVNNVKKLEEKRSKAGVLAGVVNVAPVVEPVPEGKPLFFYECAETFKSSVVRIKTKLGNAGDLTSQVPTILQAQHDTATLDVHQISDGTCQLHHALQQL